jgi:hypothetical protein
VNHGKAGRLAVPLFTAITTATAIITAAALITSGPPGPARPDIVEAAGAAPAMPAAPVLAAGDLTRVSADAHAAWQPPPPPRHHHRARPPAALAAPIAPVAVAAPATPRAIAAGLLPGYGWAASQFGCLDQLWTRESGWDPGAENPYSGAYGIPQALPGSKMAAAGPDWATGARTQILWGLGYIRGTYGSPCAAWGHEEATGWY